MQTITPAAPVSLLKPSDLIIDLSDLMELRDPSLNDGTYGEYYADVAGRCYRINIDADEEWRIQEIGGEDEVPELYEDYRAEAFGAYIVTVTLVEDDGCDGDYKAMGGVIGMYWGSSPRGNIYDSPEESAIEAINDYGMIADLELRNPRVY